MTMNTSEINATEAPETIAPTLANDPSTIQMGDTWDTGAIVSLIRRNTTALIQPKILMLGEREIRMLRRHLAQAFGEEQIACQKQIFYVGMKVVEIRTPSLVKIAGEKPSPTLERLHAHRSASLDTITSRWAFRI